MAYYTSAVYLTLTEFTLHLDFCSEGDTIIYVLLTTDQRIKDRIGMKTNSAEQMKLEIPTAEETVLKAAMADQAEQS